MAKANYTPYQQGIINRYYENRDAIMLQKLQELVSELYLADTESVRNRLWDRVRKALTNLKISPDMIARLCQSRSPEALARHLQDWLKTPAKK